MAPHLRAGGEKILPKSLTQGSAEGRSRLDDVVEVAAGGIKGAASFSLRRKAGEHWCSCNENIHAEHSASM